MIAALVSAERVRASSADEIPAHVSRVCDAEEGRLPDRVLVDLALLPSIKAMLKASPTFREQCRRVATTRLLYVRLRVNGWLADLRFRALTRILRFRSGVVIAEMELRTSWAPEEWIAHEFEHVLEQVDRVSLVDLAARSGRVWRTSDDSFESERAIQAGRTVAAEVRRRQRGRGDEFVE